MSIAFPLSRLMALIILGMSLLLLACGGARQEPFDPADPEPEDPDPVTVDTWAQANWYRVEPEGEDKRLLIARDVDRFWELMDIYIEDQSGIFAPDMEEGQIVVFDGGLIDDRNCVRKLVLREASAEQTNNDVVTLTLEFDNVPPVSGETCSGDPINIRPSRFFYVHSRDDLIIRETLR